MRIAILDGNNLAYKSYSVFKESRSGLLTNSFGVPTTVIFSLLRTFHSLVQKTQFDHVVICWDTSGSYYRRGLFPLYKKHRVYTDMKDYFLELDACREHLEIMGFNQAIAKGIEADDSIGFLAHTFKDQGHKVVVVSDDKDFYQIVRPGIKIYRPIKDCFMSLDEVLEEFEGVPPRELPRIKAITGEGTDFIPGVCDIDEKEMKLIKCNLGEKTAIKMIKGMKTLGEAIEKWQDNPKTKRPFKDILVAKKKQILMSYKLARIRTKEKYYLDWEKVLLKGLMETVLVKRKVKLKTVIKLKNDLEFKAINLPFILRGVGIDLGVKSL